MTCCLPRPHSAEATLDRLGASHGSPARAERWPSHRAAKEDRRSSPYSLVLLVWLGAALLALPGCVRFEPKPLRPEETGARLLNRNLSDPSLRTFLETNLHRTLPEWPLAKWDFPTLTLAALYYQPSVAVARAQWETARAGVRTAGARPNPTLILLPGYDFQSTPGVSPWLPQVELDWLIETAGKRKHRLARAQHLVEAAELNLASVGWQVRDAVRTHLLDFTVATRRAALLRQQIDLQGQWLTLQQNRLAAGAIAQSELASTRILLAKTRLDLGTEESLATDAHARIAEAVGVPLSALDRLELTFDLTPTVAGPLTSPQARRDALQNRADLRAALAEYAAAEAELRLEIARQYPDLRLGNIFLWDQGESKWSVGPTFDLPVFHHNQGPIAEAEARRSELAARFLALQAGVIASIDRALANFQVAQDQLSKVQGLLLAQRQQTQAADAQFQAGALDRTELLTTQLELLGGQLVELEALARAQQAIGALEDGLRR